MRENAELSAKWLSVTNERDRLRSQLHEAGVEVTGDAGGKSTDGGNIIEEKVTCTGFMFKLAALLICRIVVSLMILLSLRTKKSARFAREWQSCR